MRTAQALNSRRIAITGATGLVGTALTAHFTALGDEVIPVSRHALPGGIEWHPESGRVDLGPLSGIDAVVHLAGENIGSKRWTPERKKQIVESRVGPTRLLAEALAALPSPAPVLISASAMGYYGDRGDKILSESESPANDFLARLVVDWENAAEPARAAGIRVVHPRSSLILTPKGGALAEMLPTARLGLGGPMGSGKQWWSWITLQDEVRAIDFLIERDDISGPVNLSTTQPQRQEDFAKILGEVLHRPAVIPAPAFALRLLIGEFADVALFASTRLQPEQLVAAGFQFEFQDLRAALSNLLS